MNTSHLNDTRPRVVIAGGTGFLGRLLIPALSAAGWQVSVLTRQQNPSLPPGVRAIHWDALTFGSWTSALDGATAVINLAGRSTQCRFTRSNRAAILQSRLNVVRALAEAVRRASAPPLTWIQASSVAWFGNTGDADCTESSLPGTGFCADVCTTWESETFAAPMPEIRRVALRFGFILSERGGICRALAPLIRAGLGGAAGSGNQWVSWIHADDAVKSVLFALQDASLHGPVVAAAPNPVRNANFMAALRRAHSPPHPSPKPPHGSEAWTPNRSSTAAAPSRAVSSTQASASPCPPSTKPSNASFPRPPFALPLQFLAQQSDLPPHLPQFPAQQSEVIFLLPLNFLTRQPRRQQRRKRRKQPDPSKHQKRRHHAPA